MNSPRRSNSGPPAPQGPTATALEASAAAADHPLATLADRRAVLDPKQLATTAEAAARALLHQGESSNTRASYGSAMRYWCAWYAARYSASLALPVSVPVVVQFIVDHAARRPDEPQDAGPSEAPSEAPDDVPGQPQSRNGRTRRKSAERSAELVTELPVDVDEALVRNGYKAKLGPPALNTLVHRIAVLSKAHQMAGTRAAAAAGSPDSEMANPCTDPLVRELLARTRRAYAQRGARPKRQRALTKDPLQLLLATCDESLKGKRDRALLLFGWATGGRRRSEIASATLENLQRIDAESFVYTLSHSKTNQRGDVRPEDVKPLVGTAAAAMQQWLAVLKAQGVQEGPIFRRIRRGGHLAEPLAPAAVRDIVRERCVLAGVEGSFSAHSLRAGFVTEAGRQNMPLPETMAMTGHQSVATVVGYFRAENALVGKLGRLLDES